jgi:2-methylisocitrate lyase-like PEP mutase family enzyme
MDAQMRAARSGSKSAAPCPRFCRERALDDFRRGAAIDAGGARIADELRDTGALNAANIVEGSRMTPAYSVRELHAMGFAMGLFPVGARLLAAAGLRAYYEAVARGDARSANVSDEPSGRFERYNRALGRDQMQAWNRLFGI